MNERERIAKLTTAVNALRMIAKDRTSDLTDRGIARGCMAEAKQALDEIEFDKYTADKSTHEKPQQKRIEPLEHPWGTDMYMDKINEIIEVINSSSSE